MVLKDAFLLGLIQGIAEWLPISSSGHLAIFHHLFGLEGGITFDIFLHISSLLVILIFFRRDVLKLLNVLLKRDLHSDEFRFIVYIICATVITGISGILLKPYLELFTLKYLPYTFLFTSILLFLSVRKGKDKINMKSSLFIGFLQGIALLPGVSRSGATISAAKITGIEDEEAFRFSFLLAIPTILGAVIYEIKEIEGIPASFLLTGFLTSFFSGMASLFLLKRAILKGGFYIFGFYTLLISVVLLFLT